jgi:hypothetical protein
VDGGGGGLDPSVRAERAASAVAQTCIQSGAARM